MDRRVPRAPAPPVLLLVLLFSASTLLPEATSQWRPFAEEELHINERLVESWKWWTMDMLKVRIKEYAVVRNLTTGQQLAGLLFDSLTGARFNRALRERILEQDSSLTRYDDMLPEWQMNKRVRELWEQRYPNDQHPGDRPTLPLAGAGGPNGAAQSAVSSGSSGASQPEPANGRFRFSRQARRGGAASGRQLPRHFQQLQQQQQQQPRRRQSADVFQSPQTHVRLPSVFTEQQERYVLSLVHNVGMSAESQFMILLSAARMAVHHCRAQFRGELWNCPVDYRFPTPDMNIQAIFDHPFHEYPEQDRDPYLKLDDSWNATLVFKKMIITGSREAAYWQALMSASLTYAMSRACATGLITCPCGEEDTPDYYPAFVAADEAAELARRSTTPPPAPGAHSGQNLNGGNAAAGAGVSGERRYRRAVSGHYAGAGGYLVQQSYYAERERESQWRAMQQRLSRENQLRAGYGIQKRRAPALAPEAGGAAPATRSFRRSVPAPTDRQQQQRSQADPISRLRSENAPTFNAGSGRQSPLSPNSHIADPSYTYTTGAPGLLRDDQQPEHFPPPTSNPFLAGRSRDGAGARAGTGSGPNVQGSTSELTYEWQSCHRPGRMQIVDNVDFAARFAEAFTRVEAPPPVASLSPRDRRRVQIFRQWRIFNSTMHNHWVGRQMVRSMRNVTCSCQGPSGSCTLKVCHYRMRPFKDIAAALKTAYLNAVPAGIRAYNGRRILTRSAAKRSPATIAGGDLVLRYRNARTLQQNFFCTQQDVFGWSGTYGRPCRRYPDYQSDQAAGSVAKPPTPLVRLQQQQQTANGAAATNGNSNASDPNAQSNFGTQADRMLADAPSSPGSASAAGDGGGGGYAYSIWGEALEAMPEDPMDARLEAQLGELPSCSVVCCGRQSYVRLVPHRYPCNCAMSKSGKISCSVCNGTAPVHFCF